MEETRPCVVIVSSSNTKPKSLIKLITKEAPEDDPANPTIVKHLWNIETKYYTADIELVGLTEYKEEIHNVEALIIHMDTNKSSGLDDLKKWESIENTDPEIKLLISNYCNNETKITKSMAMDWCLKHGFEFIELYPTTQEIDDQDIIPEKVGVERIVEALQAHVWSNLNMKSDTKIGQDKLELDNVLTEEASDDFTELFNQLHLIKDSIDSMPTRQRKQCAEQMVTAFWKAIGGDEEEIADL